MTYRLALLLPPAAIGLLVIGALIIEHTIPAVLMP